MAAVNTSIGIGGGGGTSLTSTSVSPGGSDRVVVAIDSSEQGYSTQVNYGGSGGTSLGTSFSQGVVDPQFGTVAYANVRRLAPGPSGATTMYHLWGGTTSTAAGSSIFLTGADQTTPLVALTEAFGIGAGTANYSSGALTGLTPGQLVIMGVAAQSVFGGVFTSISSANAATTVVAQALGTSTGSLHELTAWAYGVADGSGNLTLEVTIVESGVLFGYRFFPYAVNDASAGGSTGTVASTLDNTTSSASGTTTVVGSVGVTLANTTSSASGSVGSPVSGTLAVTLANTTSTASGTTTVIGTIAYTISNTVSSILGSTTILGTIARTLGNTTMSGSGFPGIPAIATKVHQKLTIVVRNSL
jgi:hypothetical protein